MGYFRNLSKKAVPFSRHAEMRMAERKIQPKKLDKTLVGIEMMAAKAVITPILSASPLNFSYKGVDYRATTSHISGKFVVGKETFVVGATPDGRQTVITAY